MLTSLRRILRYGFRNFFGDREIAAATVFVLFLSVSLVGLLFLSKDISKVLLGTIQDKVDISVYFKQDVTEDEVLDFRKKVIAIPEVKEADYVSQDQALQDFVAKHQNDPTILESVQAVGVNPFLASLNIKANDPNQYSQLSSFLENPQLQGIIQKVDYFERKTVIDKVAAITSTAGKLGLLLFGVSIVLATLVSFNTIRLSIYDQKEEIKIQRLVGAPNWYIRGPFMVQAAIGGIVAVMLAVLLFSIAVWFLAPKLTTYIPELDLTNLFRVNFLEMVAIQLVVGIGLAIFSSTVAIRRYLQV